MERINTPGAVTGLPNFPTGKKGYTDGSPNVTAPTGLDASSLNAIQEELAQFMEAQGLTVQNTGTEDYTQLTTAIRNLKAVGTTPATTLTGAAAAPALALVAGGNAIPT